MRRAREDGEPRSGEASGRVAEDVAADQPEELRQVVQGREIGVAGDQEHWLGQGLDLVLGDILDVLVTSIARVSWLKAAREARAATDYYGKCCAPSFTRRVSARAFGYRPRGRAGDTNSAVERDATAISRSEATRFVALRYHNVRREEAGHSGTQSALRGTPFWESSWRFCTLTTRR